MDEGNENAARPPQAVRPRRWRRWAIAGTGLLVLLIFVGYLSFNRLATPYVRAKLEAMIASQLNAELRMEGMKYVYPFGVEVRGASLVAKGEDGTSVELLNAPQLSLQLARAPFGSGPLVVRKVMLKDPAVHVIRTAQGVVGRTTLVKDVPGPTTNPIHRRRLSEMFELRLVSIEGGRLIYEDRTRSDSLPMAWRGIDARLTTEPTQNPLYRFEFSATSGVTAAVGVGGQFHIDDLELMVESMDLSLVADPEQKESAAPVALQQLLREYGVAGCVRMDGTARVPLTDVNKSHFDVTVKLTDAKLRPPGAERGVDRATMTLRVTDLPGGEISATVENLEAQSAEATVLVPRARAVVDLTKRQWRVEELAGKANLAEAKDGATKPAAELYGSADFNVVAAGGWGDDVPVEQRYRADVRVTAPTLIATDRKLLLSNVHGQASLTPAGLVIDKDPQTGRPGFFADVYGGRISAEAKLKPGTPWRYDARMLATDVNLGQLAQALSKGDTATTKASGRGFTTFTFGGNVPAKGETIGQGLTGYGEFEVVDGDFYELPGVKQIAAAVKAGPDAARVGQAAGVFRIHPQTVRFEKIAISAPVLGLQGSGEMTFDGDMDFRVVAAPLADWKQGLQRTKIPLIGSIGAEVVGGVQKMLNTATGKLLYQFRVTGKPGNPEVNTEPVPVLKEGAIKLFATMMQATKGDRLLEQLKSGQ